jgi:hypothetical protein
MSLGGTSSLVDVVRLGSRHQLGLAENVWLAALGLAVLGPALANVAPRLMRPLAALGAMAAMATAFVATYRQDTVLALALITFAVTCGFVATWSAATLRTAVGPLRVRPLPRQRIVQGLVLRGADARAFDRL